MKDITKYCRFKGLGPGGIKCPCCTDYSTSRKIKKQKNKRIRKLLKKLILTMFDQ